ncbi:Xaa-Pro peptidase family protein [Gammaproteobacteria bacterium]|nr:Xaa-Pro peptidase family protein [Gammaproteobacteria bacterium]
MVPIAPHDLSEPERHQRKIAEAEAKHNYSLAIGVLDGGNPAHREWQQAGLLDPDLDIIRAWRLDRLRKELKKRNIPAIILTDPLNVRYATDCTNMQLWCMHNEVRYAFVAADGPVVMFDFHSCSHLSANLPLISETRGATAWFWFESGGRESEMASNWANEIHALLGTCSDERLIAIDKCDPLGYNALLATGLSVVPGMEICEEARKIKHAEELKAMRRAIHTAETGMAAMWQALQPGITENQLWSLLHQANIARGGEWIETRLLASGPRTNPWFHESSDRQVQAGEVLAFDTDLVGAYGYCADISRSWVTPGKAPSKEQQTLNAIANEHIAYNASLIRPGLNFLELSAQSHRLPDDCREGRYGVIVHGVGLCDEYPSIRYPEDVEHCGYDGVFEVGMCVCVEAYVGRSGGHEGIKQEIQGVITDKGFERLDQFSDELIPDISAYL